VYRFLLRVPEELKERLATLSPEGLSVNREIVVPLELSYDQQSREGRGESRC
jgi:hypothetical protein